jgi:hypothetical protein
MGSMTRIFQHAALVIGGLGMTVLVGGCSALESLTNGGGSSQSSGTYDESRDARSASGRYDPTYDRTYDRGDDRYGTSSGGGYGSSSSSSSSGRYDSSTGRYDSTPGSNTYEERKARRAEDQYNNPQDRTYEERKAARQRDQYDNGY